MSEFQEHLQILAAASPGSWQAVINKIENMVPNYPPFDSANKEESEQQWIRSTYQRECLISLLKELGVKYD